MPHVALITTSYPDHEPGSEAAGSFVEDFALELSKVVRTTVLAAGTAESTQTTNSLAVRRFAVPRLPLSLLRPHMPTDWRAVIQTLRAGQRATARLVDVDRPDHILSLWALPSGWWARSATQRTTIPYSTWALGSDIWSLGRIPFVRRSLRATLSEAAHRYADGIDLCKSVELLCGKPCDFLPSSRRLPKLSKSARNRPPYRLAFLGRWHPNKGADLLMDALGLLGDTDWNRIEEVRVCGGGPLAGYVRESEKKLLEQGRPVTVRGYLDKAAAADLISWADYLLLPSRIESIPVVFSDALQLGTPIVASPVGDLPRLNSEYGFGIVADGANADAFFNAVRAAINADPASYQSELERARADFDVNTTVSKFVHDAFGKVT